MVTYQNLYQFKLCPFRTSLKNAQEIAIESDFSDNAVNDFGASKHQRKSAGGNRTRCKGNDFGCNKQLLTTKSFHYLFSSFLVGRSKHIGDALFFYSQNKNVQKVDLKREVLLQFFFLFLRNIPFSVNPKDVSQGNERIGWEVGRERNITRTHQLRPKSS